MKVSELKKILGKVDDDKEVLVDVNSLTGDLSCVCPVEEISDGKEQIYLSIMIDDE